MNKLMFGALCVQVALTSDAWTSKATDSYVTITVVFMVDWKIENFVLQTRQMPESHTGLSLSLSLLCIWFCKVAFFFVGKN